MTGPLAIEIDQLGQLGDGLGTLDGKRVMVAGTLPGEIWHISKPEKRQGQWRATPLDPLKLQERLEPRCRHFGQCGGCVLQHLPTDLECSLKIRRIETALAHRGIEAPPLLPLIQSPLHSRRRLRLAFDGKGRLGLRQRFSKRIADMKECIVADPDITAALPDLRSFSRILGRPGEFSITSLSAGLDVFLIGFDAVSPDALTFAGKAGWLRLAAALRPDDFRAILMQRSEPFITLAGVKVALPVGAFLQATPNGETALQDFAVNWLKGHHRVADFFAGLGTLALALANAGHQVTAFDSDKASLDCLGQTGKIAAVQQIDLFRETPKLNRFDAVVLDPPRAGAEHLCEAIAQSNQRSIVYASCSPRSFARDAEILTKAGFGLLAIQPIDQFRYSAEIELISVFER